MGRGHKYIFLIRELQIKTANHLFGLLLLQERLDSARIA